MLYKILCFIFLSIHLDVLYGQVAYQSLAEEWKGESLKADEGVFVVNAILSGFKKNKESAYLQSSIQFLVLQISTNKLIMVSQPVFDKEIEDAPNSYWKLKLGEYRITKVLMVDAEGTTRTWTPVKKSKSFFVKQQKLSNLGRWRLSPLEAEGLNVAVKMQEIPARDAEPLLKNFTHIINGYDHSVQQNGDFLGQDVGLVNSKNTNQTGSMTKAYTFTRTISMFYKVDLFRHNRHAKKLVKVLNIHDAKFRKCYTEILNDNERAKGKIKFKFVLSKYSKSLKNIQTVEENVREPNLTNCIYRGLQDVRFAVNSDIPGEVTYTFDTF